MRHGLCLIGLLMGLPAAAGERTPETVLPVEGINELTGELVRAIDAVGRADLRASAARFRGLAFPSDNPVGEDDAIIRLLQPFGGVPADFDSVDFVAAAAISTRAYELSYVAHGRRGPVYFRFRAFRSHDGWRVLNVHFDTDWTRMLRATREGRFDAPVTIPTRARIAPVAPNV